MAYKRPIRHEKKIVKMYGEGSSLREIAFIEGCHKTTIKRRLERAGVKMRDVGPLPGRKSTVPWTDKEKAESMKYLYGMTPEGYSETHKLQNGKCAICGKKLPAEWGHGVHIDHCHKTKKVRGLLCPKCNIGLGQFGDNSEHLLTAASYIVSFDKWRL